MKIRLGYVAITNALNVTTSRLMTYTEFSKNKDISRIDEIIRSNLQSLNQIIDYNVKNNIHFYRLSSKLIPLATKDDVHFDYIDKFKDCYKIIGNKIKKFNLRIDFHPDQFCVLNSTKSEIVQNSISIIKYHYKILKAFNIKDKVIILHIGSNVFGKKSSITRFVNNFKKLPKYLQKCIVIENDDKIFNIQDCLMINKVLKIPIVLDYHHHVCNYSDINFNLVFKTWAVTPKIHFSSPKNKTKKDFRAHHDYIDIDSFIDFLKIIKGSNYDLDIMLEAKAKDDALFRLVRQLKYYGYQFIDETTFIN